jgi:histone acetyltransferase (RNA polymerase elongator complex component)
MPLVIPIFIPHQGCPQHCLFCNQISISGKKPHKADDVELVRKTVSEWLGFSHTHSMVQVAFYGGSFTCLSLKRQELYLGAVRPFLEKGEVDSIRLSTRPDCIDNSICDFLLQYGVKTVELGVQSLDDRVLEAADRGHSRVDSLRAIQTIQEKDLELGVQLMPGLPHENTQSFLATLDRVIDCNPDFVRLYPTLVINGSGLAKEYKEGRYQPMSMNRAVALCCNAKEKLEKAGIQIMRMGLQASKTLEKELLAGPYHPSFGELVASRHWFKRVRSLLAGCPSGKDLNITISHRDVSAFVGPKRVNMRRLQELGMRERLKLTTDKSLKRGTMNYVIN